MKVVSLESAEIWPCRMFADNSVDLFSVSVSIDRRIGERISRRVEQQSRQTVPFGQVRFDRFVCLDSRLSRFNQRLCLDLIDEPSFVVEERNLIEAQQIFDYFSYRITPRESQFLVDTISLEDDAHILLSQFVCTTSRSS